MKAALATLPVPARRRPAHTVLACGALGAAMLAFIVLGHDGRRVVQLCGLAMPVLLWLFWPARSVGLHNLRTVAVWLWAMVFVVDGALRAYLLDAYQAAPGSSLVLAAAANTNARETAEYLSMNGRSMALWALGIVAAALVLAYGSRRGLRVAARWPRWAVVLVAAMLLLGGISYASKPWRRLHPVIFWTNWSEAVQALRTGWSNHQGQREAAMDRARLAAPAVMRDGPGTLVLVISDSINRDNMALYGYGRATTPRLIAHRGQLEDAMLVLRNAWSVDASTLPALRNLFGFGEPDREHPQHLLALARAAGYKVWWMSNHDDIAIEHQHALMADVVEMVNRTPGRAGGSLDGELLAWVREALDDPAERKLIVVHLMGAHPHYRLRFPVGENPFDDGPDAVEADLVQRGRAPWVRRFRAEYDAAMLYHDSVVAETLQMTRKAGRTDEYRAWMYLSDHGQEVGHESGRAGHSPATASGYRVPTVIWRNRPAAGLPADVETRPFRTDWAAWTIADLLGIQWQGDAPERNVLREGYRWRPPELPVAIRSFTD